MMEKAEMPHIFVKSFMIRFVASPMSFCSTLCCSHIFSGHAELYRELPVELFFVHTIV